ncbi:VOC family protein [Winogradskyella psychrotolerans]|uniref:VOC family protein n=1 Tax=Winogradskyella psychrotolerans TaxID=1344585 RepID=UPI001C072579|nr:VOC family protein [Winogradskyella psychrotolerans]MBU2930248.1 VOC family protein [Winogradskyella psychrotolerans]
MIKGLFETHLFVENLETSIDFYKNTLGLQQCYFETERRAAFFWIGKPKEAMLGLWEKPKSEIEKRHFAFRCDKEFILNHASAFLKQNQLQPYNFLKDGTDQPMVFSWMPAIAIYFNDLDGHYLEFISILEGKARPELGVISYDQWIKVTAK